MEKPFRLDGDVYRQLSIINRLELRADLTVQSLYAKAVLELPCTTLENNI